jgi:hypothetical protein
MAEDRAPSPTTFSDYDAIERAVAETERGRWFLGEYSRRVRMAETRTLLDAIARLEDVLAQDHQAPDVAPIRSGLADMAELISRARARVAIAPFDTLEPSAVDALAVVARTSRRVAASLTTTADHIRDTAASLRDQGIGIDLCRAVERHATEVSTTAKIQDLTAQRVGAIVEALRRLEEQIEGLRLHCEGPAPRSAVAPSAPETRVEAAFARLNPLARPASGQLRSPSRETPSRVT